MVTLASLFDGVGTFPLAATLNGIIPVWSSEIEPYPCRVTSRRFPNMHNYGDVTKIKGSEVPPVDIITFGSPCQNLSRAGAQEGLFGIESRLFFEAIRIIDEMRKATNNEYPKIFIWENVANSISISDGADFQKVIESVVEIIEQQKISIPKPDKWRKTGGGVGRNGNFCWRILNSSGFGVPQIRRRIFLVGCFGNTLTSGQILYSSNTFPEDFKPEYSNNESCGFSKYINPKLFNSSGFTGTKEIEHLTNYTLNGFKAKSNDLVFAQNTPLKEKAHTLCTSCPDILINEKIVRYLTPLEYSRLQGFPDWWGTDVQHTPTEYYKAFGNGISLPIPIYIFYNYMKLLKGENKNVS